MKRKKNEIKEDRLFGWVAESFGEAARDLIINVLKNVNGLKGGLDKRSVFSGKKILKEGGSRC
jgi:hypothetical protein